MSVVEIIVIVAIAVILFIVIRRLPQTRNIRSAPTIMHSAPERLTSGVGKIGSAVTGSGRLTGIFNKGKNGFGTRTGKFFSRFGFIANILEKRRKKREMAEEEFKKQLKTKEARSFWIDGEKKEDAATSHLLATTFFDQAEAAFEAKDLRKAESLYLEAARENPHNAKIFNRLGVIYLEQQNFGDAIEAFTTSVQFDDHVSSRHFNLGLAYLGQGKMEEAVEHLKRAVDLEPKKEKYRKILEEVKQKC